MPVGAFRLNSLARYVAAAAGRTAKTVTAYGNVNTNQSNWKFGGASAVFDGTGDYLSVSPTTDLAFGTGDFTIEFYFRTNTVTGDHLIYDGRVAGSYGSNSPVIYQQNATIKYYMGNDRLVTGTISVNTWYHIAVSRSGSSTRLFLNGALIGTFTDSTSLICDTNLWIGAHKAFGAGTYDFNGNIDELRVSNSARYTAAFTVPNSPFVNDANTVLLLHMNGTHQSTTFTDDIGTRVSKTITANGNVKVSTTQSKFGGASAYFDGTGDYLSVPFDDLSTGQADFTWEAWCYFANDNTDCKLYGGNTTGDMDIRRTNDGMLRIGTLAQAWQTSSSAMTNANTWVHLAVCRSGTTCKLFRNGVDITASGGTNNTIYVINTPLTIGYSTAYGLSMNGYMDEIRFSNTARYTTGFTAPTTAFTNDANTLLLIHANGANNSTTFTDDNS